MDVPEGIVIPPSEVRDVVEKTVQYVERNGAEFENRLKRTALQDGKLTFLLEDNEYYSYYKWRVHEIRAGRSLVSKESPEPVEAKSETKEPYKFEFSEKLPLAAPEDIEVLRLAALYVASNGIERATNELRTVYRDNAQFAFLNPKHSLHQYFSAMIAQYQLVLRAPISLRNRIREIIDNKQVVYEWAKQRAIYQQQKLQEEHEVQDAKQKEAIEYSEIDWQDFVVVQTIEFTEEDRSRPLPPPVSLSDLQRSSLETKNRMLTIEDGPAYADSDDSDENDENDEKKHKNTNANPRQMTLCQLCKRYVPEADYPEHIRVELLDPKWKQEKLKAEARAATTNLDTSAVTENLRNLARHREDIFDNTRKRQRMS
ncbi:hypothetical protein CANCADRAFT_98053 [Tortispora caseinolytica NRRL Y-17796]|uniref:SURP motif domain-containing protein n=1 Tax=Tortispora caseinolytica NRRL Y-17796 TaxID=767744 RepID=A0A1E4TDZ0_9ASCO|nr:hypothetical protein CANCADRAFT_98053 [Tortispora caseinolytica NRRL Y-17796]